MSSADSCCNHLRLLLLQHILLKQRYSVPLSAAAMGDAAAECMRLL